MTDRRRARLERRISDIPVPPPPAGLAERIKRDIPERLPASGAESLTELSPYRIWLRVAAILLVILSSSFVAMQLLVRDSGQPSRTTNVARADLERGADVAVPPPAAIPRIEPENSSARTNVPGAEKPSLRDAASAPAPAPRDLQKAQIQAEQTMVARGRVEDYPATKNERVPREAADSAANRPPTPSIDQIASATEAKEATRDSRDRSASNPDEIHSEGIVGGVAGGKIGARLPATAAPSVAESAAPVSVAQKQAATGSTRRADHARTAKAMLSENRGGQFIDAEEMPASSVPLQIGSESYLAARSHLLAGRLPPPDSVRAEEFVNFFQYGDSAPQGGDFALAAQGSVSPFPSGPRNHVMRIGVLARRGSNIEGAEINVDFNPAVVQRYRLIGFDRADKPRAEPDPDGATGQIASRQGVTFPYELKLQPGYRRSDTLATIRLRYRSSNDEIVEISRELSAGEVEKEWLDASRSIQLASIASTFAELLGGEKRTANVDLEMLARRARVVANGYPADADVAELVKLIETAAKLKKGSSSP